MLVWLAADSLQKPNTTIMVLQSILWPFSTKNLQSVDLLQTSFFMQLGALFVDYETKKGNRWRKVINNSFRSCFVTGKHTNTGRSEEKKGIKPIRMAQSNYHNVS